MFLLHIFEGDKILKLKEYFSINILHEIFIEKNKIIIIIPIVDMLLIMNDKRLVMF